MWVDCFEEAPAEWPRKPISELAKIDPPYELEVGCPYPFIEMASVHEGFGGISKFDIRVWDRSGLCRFADNDIILGRKVLTEPPIAGTSPQSRPEPPGTPILNVSCVKGGVCDPAQVTYVDVTDEDVERYRAEIGDFYVLCGNGNRNYVATGGLLRETPPENAIYSDKLIRLRFDPKKVAPRFIPYMW